MSPTQPLGENEIEVRTFDREHLSAVLFRALGFTNADILADTLKRNPHLVDLPLLLPENTVVRIERVEEQIPVIPARTLWS